MTSPPSSLFPAKAALAALTAVILLYAWHVFRDPGAGISPGIFREAAGLRVPHAPPSTNPERPLNGTEAPGSTVAKSGAGSSSASGAAKPAQGQIGSRPSPSTVLADPSGALDPLFAQLANLEQQRPSEVVTILHYGDSPTTADLITGDARALLQARFGDAGHGFNLVGKPWAWYGHREVAISDHGWKALTGVGSMRQGVYGLGGATLVGSAGAHSSFKLADGAQTAAEVQYLSEPNGGSFAVSADGNQLAVVSTAGDADTPATRLLQLPSGTKQIELNVTSGEVRMLGIDLRKGNSGILYDSLGLNGASTTVVSRTFAPGPWSAELRHAAPALVILNYGTNESTFGSFVQKQYEPELRAAIAKTRAALPDVPILVMSPMDRGERGGLNEIHTMATIPEIVAIQARVAADLHCAFFDTFRAMGGDGTMSRWYTASPRLVTADLIHPTPQGARIVAEQLVNNLLLGYEQWKRAHGIVTPVPMRQAIAAPQVAAPVTPPAAPRAKPSAARLVQGQAEPASPAENNGGAGQEPASEAPAPSDASKSGGR